ncbi:hypothetical protein GCM10009539_16860 [Cryptosporangium japonicum]|uniref:Uncharacterized protein n=1 Tax=Cryptosporangium japonicum TaxID=80872 RepID=A0ABP3DGG3_9ACTN
MGSTSPKRARLRTRGRQSRGLGNRLEKNEPGSSVVGATEGGGAAGEELREGEGRADRVTGACTSGAGPRGARADGDLLLAGEEGGGADGER